MKHTRHPSAEALLSDQSDVEEDFWGLPTQVATMNQYKTSYTAHPGTVSAELRKAFNTVYQEEQLYDEDEYLCELTPL